MPPESCSQRSIAAGEPLAGTASEAERFVLLEVRKPWGRDALPESDLPASAKEALDIWLAQVPRSRVLFVRKPERRAGPFALFTACIEHDGGTLRRTELSRYEELREHDLGAAGVPVAAPLFLVCTHGRRDLCCGRLGRPVYEALRRFTDAERVWQSSHQGGHRFAGNVLVLPAGIQLGRVRPGDAAAVADAVERGRVPMEHYRGRTLYPPAVQAAEAAVRSRLGLAGLDHLVLESAVGGECVFGTSVGQVSAWVDEREEALRPESCGAEPAPWTRRLVRTELP